MEQRALQFEQLTNSMNTAFTTLQTAQGITSAISDGIVSDRSYEEQAKLDNSCRIIKEMREQSIDKIINE